ncbi:MAG: hypothetical protein KAT05_04490 [Spirochaetes bacterium]|nr:hypothetical protein [Spirochaetota bacterium]
MFNCSECGHNNNLIVCLKCNTIVCDAHHKTDKCYLCNNDVFYKIYKESINGNVVDFISLNRFPVGFYGFERIDKSLMEFIGSISEINISVEKEKIIIFPNKIESVRFIQSFDSRLYKHEEKNIQQSKYSRFICDDLTFFLLNFEKVKSSEIGFLIKLLILENINPDRMHDEYENYKKIVYNALKITNGRIGINYVSFNGDDDLLSSNFFETCYKIFHSYTANKKLLKENPLDLLDYLQHKIELNNLLLCEKNFYYIYDLFSLYVHILGLKLIEKSIEENPGIHSTLSKIINNNIEKSISIFENEDVKNIFTIFISDIKMQNFDEHKYYINFIKSSINLIFEKAPLIFLRYYEIYEIFKESKELINRTQLVLVENPKLKIPPTISECFESVFKINQILSKEIPLQYRLLLLNTKFIILKEIIINTSDNTFFNILLETQSELEELLLQNYKWLKKDDFFGLDVSDILINYDNIALIYFTFNDTDNVKEIFNNKRRKLKLYNIPDYLKISMLFVDFQFFEEYSNLKEIHKICLNYSKKEGVDFHDVYSQKMNEVICNFSSYFSENKGDLLEILNSIEDQIVIQSPVIKNIFEVTGLKIFIGMFYHIVNATKQDAKILMISEVEKALKLAEFANKINSGRYPNDYYLLKTRTIIEILNEDINELKTIISKLDHYDLKSKDNFKNAINYWLDSTLEIHGKNIDILSKLKDVDDPWCNLIYKIIKEKIRHNSYYEAKSELEYVRKLTNVNEQLIKFRDVVERNCINAFWKSRIKGDLKPRPEEIGKSLLVTFFHASEFYTYIGTENEEGVGMCDVLTISKKNEKNIFELKIVKSKADIDIGIKELVYYLSKEKLKEGFLILFDTRKLNHKIKESVVKDNKKINIFLLKINETAPSK